MNKRQELDALVDAFDIIRFLAATIEARPEPVRYYEPEDLDKARRILKRAEDHLFGEIFNYFCLPDSDLSAPPEMYGQSNRIAQPSPVNRQD
jgi:hypothetical protein